MNIDRDLFEDFGDRDQGLVVIAIFQKIISLWLGLIAIRGVFDRDQMQYLGRFVLLSFYWDFCLGTSWDGS